jgi:hypothetical protein
MTRSSLFLEVGLAALAALTLTAGDAGAQKKKKIGATGPTACNLKSIPLAAGNSWTYRSGGQTVTIKVLDVGPGKDFAGKAVTVANVEETFNDNTTKTVFTCTPAGLQVPLESFFFTAEPGGGVGTAFTVTARDRVTWLPDGEIAEGNGWIEAVKADAVRTDMGGAGAEHMPAKIEVERHVNVRATEKLMIGLGEFNTTHIIFELRGRGIIGDERSEIPIKRPGAVWMVKGVGYVKVDDTFDKTWELVESSLVPQ